MKTAVFFLSPFCGGAERMTITIAKLLDRSEYDVRFVVIGQRIGEIKEFIPKDYPLDLVKIRNIFDFTTLRVYRYLKKVRPQYVFCSLHYLNPRVILASRWVGRCKVILRFNCAVEGLKGLNKYLTNITYRKADVIIAQTEQMQDDLERTFHLPQGIVVTMHNMLDRSTIDACLADGDNPYIKEKNKVFVWIGRLSPEKSVEIAVKAFDRAFHKNGNISLYLVGKYDAGGDYYKYLKDIVDSTEARMNIHFMGFQSNPYKWIKYADCFILSSRTEASPNALFESLYLGVPAVSTRCTPNIDDIIDDGVNGYKVGIGDYMTMTDRLLDALHLNNVKSKYVHSDGKDFVVLFR